MRASLSPTAWYAGIAAALALAATAIAAGDAPAQEPELFIASPSDPVMRERIRAFEAGSARPLGGMMGFRRADGQMFYLINPPCCDRFNDLYDSDGRRICAPSGGFGGSGDGRCPAWVGELWRGASRWPPAGNKPATTQGY